MNIKSTAIIRKGLAVLSIATLAVSALGGHGYALNTPYAASGVLGQPDFTSNSSATTANGMDEPWGGSAIDSVHHRLFVSDTYNYRVLVYALDNNLNLVNHTPINVIGQPDFTSSNYGYGAAESYTPTGIAYDAVNNRLFVSNYYMVNVYNLNNGVSNGMAASYELGQAAGFGSSTCTISQNNVCGLEGGLAFDAAHERLFVVDSDGNRVLVFNVAPSSLQSGENASYVIGEPDFTTTSGGSTQAALFENYYGGVVYIASSQTLVVADTYANRVLSYDLSSGISNGMNASHVIGQSDFMAHNSGTTASTFYSPTGLGYDPDSHTLFVDDGGNSRVLLFNVANGFTNSMAASGVLGQTDFTSSVSGSSQTSFSPSYSTGLEYDTVNHRLYVPDYSNSRVVTFDFVHLTSASLPAVALDGSYSQTLTTAGSQGSLSFSVTGGHLPPGLSLNQTTGEISGTASKAGSYSFELSVSDNNGTIGTFTQDPQYTIKVTTNAPTVTAPRTGYGAQHKQSWLPLALTIIGLLVVGAGFRYLHRRDTASAKPKLPTSDN